MRMVEPRLPAAGAGALEEARVALGFTYQRMWVDYFGAGGNGTLDDVRSWLAGSAPLSVRDHDFLAQALNDEFCARGQNHPLAYRHRSE